MLKKCKMKRKKRRKRTRRRPIRSKWMISYCDETVKLNEKGRIKSTNNVVWGDER